MESNNQSLRSKCEVFFYPEEDFRQFRLFHSNLVVKINMLFAGKHEVMDACARLRSVRVAQGQLSATPAFQVLSNFF